MSPPAWPKAGKSATLEAATPETVAGLGAQWAGLSPGSAEPARAVDRALRRRGSRPRAPPRGGHFDHGVAALAPADTEAAPVIVPALALVAIHARPALGLPERRAPIGGECAVVQRLDAELVVERRLLPPGPLGVLPDSGQRRRRGAGQPLAELGDARLG